MYFVPINQLKGVLLKYKKHLICCYIKQVYNKYCFFYHNWKLVFSKCLFIIH